MLIRCFYAVALCIGLGGCARDKPRSARQSSAGSVAASRLSRPKPMIPPVPCFAPDSLRRAPLTFGIIEHSAEDGDWSGVEFSFIVDSGGLRGRVRDARGGLPPNQPLQEVRYDASRDSLAFWYDSDSGTRYYYSLRPACDSLVGTGRLFVTATDPAGTIVRKVFPRVLHPPQG